VLSSVNDGGSVRSSDDNNDDDNEGEDDDDDGDAMSVATARSSPSAMHEEDVSSTPLPGDDNDDTAGRC
jgi:hypothetical protein